MVVADMEEISCEIYEIKHTDQIFANQYRHLIDEEKCSSTIHEYGPIRKKIVLYRGPDQEVDQISYRNVTNYLENILSKRRENIVYL